MSEKQKAFANLLAERGLQFEQEVRDLPGSPDVFFRSQAVAVFFHGCFWHNHTCRKAIENSVTASQRAGQALRDLEQQRELLRSGFKYVIIWECEYDDDPDAQVVKILDRLHFSR